MNTYNTYIYTYIHTQRAFMYGVQDVGHKVSSVKYKAQSVAWPIKGRIINAGRKVWEAYVGRRKVWSRNNRC